MSDDLNLEALEALARYNPEAPVRIEARAGDLARALQAARGGGPAVLSTRQCAQEFGWTDSDWRRWAPEILGAARIGKRWRIPREGAQGKADQLMKRKGGNPAPSDSGGGSGPRTGGNHGKFRSRKEAAQPSPARAGAPAIPIGKRRVVR
jgi:hypothetical protein